MLQWLVTSAFWKVILLLSRVVTVTVDRPLGSTHPTHKDIVYPVNYGYVEGIPAPDGEWQDAYILGVEKPVTEFTGEVIAVIRRFDDIEDKWVVAPSGKSFSPDEIAEAVKFQEQYFKGAIEMTENKDTAVLYVHGKGGNAAEAEHYKKLFPAADVFGFDYKAENPWEAKEEFPQEFRRLKSKYKNLILIANSIGAYFSMSAEISDCISKAYFISPIVSLERLIENMMLWAGVSESTLKEKKIIKTDFGEDLSWDYLCYIRNNPVEWSVPTEILRGSEDNLQSLETITEFAKRTGAVLTVMEGGEHWFHTDEQMKFLDNWVCSR